MFETDTEVSGEGRAWSQSVWPVLLLLGGIAACDAKPGSIHSTLETVGLADAPASPPLSVAVLCDPTEGSVCARGAAETITVRLIRTVLGRPGSDIVVYALGATPDETRRVASFTIPPAVERGSRAARAAQERFVLTVTTTLCASLDDALLRERPRQTPLAEGLDEVALARPDARRPLLVVALTDLKEYSPAGDFECARGLPTPEAFRARLDRHNLLTRGALDGASVAFVVGDRGPVQRRRCAVSMGRERELQAVWSHVLTAAGARRVSFHAELPTEEQLASLVGSTADATPSARRPQ